MKTKIETIARMLLWSAAALLLLVFATNARAQLIKWSAYPNTNHIADTWLGLWAQTGVTNWNMTYLQFVQQLSTDTTVLSNLQANLSFSTNSSTTYGLLILSNQTSLLFDFATIKNYQVFSTYTNDAVPVTLSLTNISVPSNGMQNLTILLRNLATNNLHYVMPSGIDWTTNYPANTNLPTAGFQLLQLMCEPTFGTNNSIIGY